MIDDTKVKLNTLFSKTVKHVCREANTVVHYLAKVALSQMLDHVWIENVLPLFRVL